jgi:hypothetical protein
MGFEEVEDAVSEARCEAVTVEAPKENDRFAAVVQVAFVLCHLVLVYQSLPVADEQIEQAVARGACQIVAQGVDSPRLGSSTPDRAENLVAGGAVREFDKKALEKNPVDAVLLHPAKVPLHGFGMHRAEKLGRPAIRVGKSGGGIFLVLIELGQVGPHLESDRVRSDLVGISTPVPPALAGRIARAAKPALVAAQDLVAQACASMTDILAAEESVLGGPAESISQRATICTPVIKGGWKVAVILARDDLIKTSDFPWPVYPLPPQPVQ